MGSRISTVERASVGVATTPMVCCISTRVLVLYGVEEEGFAW
jgi:hypothetical protein